MPLPRPPVALALALAATLPALAEDRAADVSLREIRSNPAAFKSQRVGFKCRLNRTENRFLAYYSPFTPEKFAQVSVWGAEEKVFIEADRLDVFPNVFAPKDADFVDELMETPKYSWIYVTGQVASDFGGEPWIAMTGFDVLSEQHFTDSSLGAAIRMYEAFRKDDLEGVLSEGARIYDYALPRTDRYHVVKMKALAAWALGRDADAKRAAERGLRVRPNDPELAAIAEGTAPRALTGEGDGGGKREDGREREGEEGAKPPEEKKATEKEPPEEEDGMETEGEEGALGEAMEKMAALERENERLRREVRELKGAARTATK
jgi:hypothetical protein